MNIQGFSQLQPMNSIFDNEVNNKSNTGSFKDIFTNAIKDVAQKEKEVEQSQYLLATGQIQDPHTVPVAAAQAQLSVDLLVTLRNKTLDAYNELMRINL